MSGTAISNEPKSEAWEARNLTQQTRDWRHFCDFQNVLVGNTDSTFGRVIGPMPRRLMQVALEFGF
jgi:hypothetical protein